MHARFKKKAAAMLAVLRTHVMPRCERDAFAKVRSNAGALALTGDGPELDALHDAAVDADRAAPAGNGAGRRAGDANGAKGARKRSLQTDRPIARGVWGGEKPH